MMHVNRGCPNEYWGVNFIQALLMRASDWCCSSYLHHLHAVNFRPAFEEEKCIDLLYLVY